MDEELILEGSLKLDLRAPRLAVSKASVLSQSSRSASRLGWGSLCLLALAGCEQEQPAAQNWERPPSAVIVATALGQNVPVYLDEIGKCVAREVVAIQPQVSGRITEIRFTDGADVRAGDVLFTIDQRPYRAQVTAAEATLARAKAVRDQAKTEFTRVQDLVNSKSVSKADFDVKKNAVAVAETEIQQAQAAVEAAQLNLDFCSIRSPISGRAGQRLVDLGNVVTPGGSPLLVIQRLNPIYAEFTVAENNLTAVQENMAKGALKVEIRLPDDLDRPSTGEMTFLDNTVQGETGTVKLRATIPNEDHRFWPGRFVRVRLILREIPDAVLIPVTAPLASSTGPFVYVVKDDMTAEMRPVRMGQRQGDLVVVEEGVKSGEKVVTNGHLGVMPGGKVRIEEPQLPATALTPEAPAAESGATSTPAAEPAVTPVTAVDGAASVSALGTPVSSEAPAAASGANP